MAIHLVTGMYFKLEHYWYDTNGDGIKDGRRGANLSAPTNSTIGSTKWGVNGVPNSTYFQGFVFNTNDSWAFIVDNYIDQGIQISSGGDVIIPQSLNLSSGTLFVDSDSRNVGIGTTSPSNSYVLDVNGDTNINGTITATTFSGSGSGITALGTSTTYRIGTLGINTNAGSYKLNVNGTTYISGATILNSTLNVYGNTVLGNQTTDTTKINGSLGIGIDANSSYSLTTNGGIYSGGTVKASAFEGDGSALTGVQASSMGALSSLGIGSANGVNTYGGVSYTLLVVGTVYATSTIEAYSLTQHPI